MAEKRMFTMKIIDSDAFLDMPLSAQALYFHLSMRADDDGFVNSPRRIMRLICCSDDDMKLLIAKNFVILFDSGIVVIKHWRIHNYIQKDRYHETNYTEEKKMLRLNKNNSYSVLDTPCIQDVSETDTEVSIGKDSLDKDSLDESTITPSQARAEFEKLWDIYPKKRGKKRAYSCYESARIRQGIEFDVIKNGMEAYIRWFNRQNKDIQYMKDGDTFFSQWSWQDDWSTSGRTDSKFAQEADDILDGIL